MPITPCGYAVGTEIFTPAEIQQMQTTFIGYLKAAELPGVERSLHLVAEQLRAIYGACHIRRAAVLVD